MYNNKKILELLVEKDTNINIKDGNGNTPLMYAIKNKNYSPCNLFVDILHLFWQYGAVGGLGDLIR